MLTILTDENKILHKKSKRVSSINDSVKKLSESLIKTMIASNGVGLAAPQCGILKRIIVVLIDSTPKIFINPEIVDYDSSMQLGEEGCLSIPNMYIQKRRYCKITAKYRNLDGHPQIETYYGLPARIIQHEIDHLNGILMTDYYN